MIRHDRIDSCVFAHDFAFDFISAWRSRIRVLPPALQPSNFQAYTYCFIFPFMFSGIEEQVFNPVTQLFEISFAFFERN
ncbi:hypothetical protein CEXT_123571 [Caerostris extrusa]|uniref:Uncharacterized protein n=1 Tax=Caerostris extrusa TaxID=172846 RepID=A0AAV4QA20_CAEEX|nr:hypothetical protein CEXT_123571 [Caerostris extrusa]